MRVALYRLEAWDTNKSRHFATRAIRTKAKAQGDWTYAQGLAVFRTKGDVLKIFAIRQAGRPWCEKIHFV